jgi:hypothetical protein
MPNLPDANLSNTGVTVRTTETIQPSVDHFEVNFDCGPNADSARAAPLRAAARNLRCRAMAGPTLHGMRAGRRCGRTAPQSGHECDPRQRFGHLKMVRHILAACRPHNARDKQLGHGHRCQMWTCRDPCEPSREWRRRCATARKRHAWRPPSAGMCVTFIQYI